MRVKKNNVKYRVTLTGAQIDILERALHTCIHCADNGEDYFGVTEREATRAYNALGETKVRAAKRPKPWKELWR